MKALIDTCVIIDALADRRPFSAAAREIMLSCANRRFEGYITAKAGTDIYYILHKYTHDDKETRKNLSALLSLVDVLDSSSADLRRAIFSDIADFEDAMMAETAMREKMDCLVTRNIKDYKASGITIFSPDEFLERLRGA